VQVARAGGAARGGFMAAAARVTQAHERNVTIVRQHRLPRSASAGPVQFKTGSTTAFASALLRGVRVGGGSGTRASAAHRILR
jgi:hypothetical protein